MFGVQNKSNGIQTYKKSSTTSGDISIQTHCAFVLKAGCKMCSWCKSIPFVHFTLLVLLSEAVGW